ncbi:AMP-binding protein [Streptomyces sp. SID8381]|uniref:AMP-binding protein n=1 Tax=unclassified Streptomyces TaxID=2593676 RepID=UPI00037862DA|nr:MULTISPECIES: AMP-binding protein [unclassified Streptomyces]MYX28882.1 AMP-binding protein [Streptomyces sp. SID8381]
MTDSVINRLVAGPPAPGHRISFIRLGSRRTLDLTELYEQSGRVAAYLQSLGVGSGDRIGILAANSLEWVLLDLAALRLKAVVAGFEPGKFADAAELVARYGLTVLFTDLDVPADAPATVRTFAEVAEAAGQAWPKPPGPVVYGPEEVTTIKFTSGSTGAPKGLGATVGSIDASMRAVQEIFGHQSGDNLFVFLPLSLLQQRYWLYSALCFGHDATVTTYEAAFAALGTARPTVVMGVPAFFEAARQQIGQDAARADGVPPEEARRAAARRLFGDRIRYLWTGSAPADREVLRYLTDAGLPVYEGYGLNETCIVSKNHPGAHREGSVGRVLRGKEVLFDEDGVILVRSEHPVNRRYEFAEPGDSERMFVADGVVRTGDLGYVDEDGFLFVQGRADDVIVLGNGKKVIVRPIEEHMRTSPAIEECVVFCPAQTSLVAVVSPSSDTADLEAITAQLARTNASFGRDEQIRKVVVASPRPSIANGMLTSQFKPRRQAIFAAFQSQITNNQDGIHAQ